MNYETACIAVIVSCYNKGLVNSVDFSSLVDSIVKVLVGVVESAARAPARLEFHSHGLVA